MLRRIPLLRGWSILAVVANHATAWVYVAMFWWVDRYRAVAPPNFDLLGTPSYYVITAISQLALFCVPAFLFVSGLFVTYTSKAESSGSWWSNIRVRLVSLLWPYLIWTTLRCLLEYAARRLTASGLPGDTTTSVIEFYFFFVLLAEFYILSPFIVRLARSHPVGLLVGSALLQLVMVAARYLILAGVRSPVIDLVARTPLSVFTRWAFYFPFGVVAGIYIKRMNQFLERFRVPLVIATVILGILSVVECQWIYVVLGNRDWAFDSPKLSTTLYAVAFILAFLAVRPKKPLLPRFVDAIGKASYGIYFVHILVLKILLKAIYHVFPALLGFPIPFLIVLVAISVGGAWLIIWLVARSPARKVYRYLFG